MTTNTAPQPNAPATTTAMTTISTSQVNAAVHAPVPTAAQLRAMTHAAFVETFTAEHAALETAAIELLRAFPGTVSGVRYVSSTLTWNDGQADRSGVHIGVELVLRVRTIATTDLSALAEAAERLHNLAVLHGGAIPANGALVFP